MENNSIDSLSYTEVVDEIIKANERIHMFWSQSEGWAPSEAAALLSKSRLDWLVSLSYSLHKWDQDPLRRMYEGDLILAWSNLGALVEGAMKFFLSVFYEDYRKDDNIIVQWGKEIDPDGGMFNQLREFFYVSIWDVTVREEKNDWLRSIQRRRNAIHAYQDKDIGDFNSFRKEVAQYLLFLLELESRVPYPDNAY